MTPDWEQLGWVERLRVVELEEWRGRVDEAELPFLPGPGWVSLVDELHHQLLALDAWYSVLQVKEKFGTLRFYAGFVDPTVEQEGRALIDAAQRRSAEVCERCGEPGRLREDRDWVLTLCGACDGAVGEPQTWEQAR